MLKKAASTGVVLLAALVGCSSGAADRSAARSPAPSSSSSARTVPHFDHIVIVVEENHGYEQVVGSRSAPYVNSLIRTGVLLTHSYAITHPSQPNYLALFSGSTHGVRSDACPQSISGAGLRGALHAKGLRFAGYSQSLPSDGSRVCRHGDYVRKHAPWVNFTDVPASENRRFSRFPAVFSRLPNVAFVIPDLAHDMHDGTVARGDAWLKAHLARYVRWARSHNSLLIVTYDEDERAEGNRIPTVLAGAHVKRGARVAARIDTYSLLRTVEDAFGTTRVGASAAATPLTTAWTS